jgi:hypothetical protein
VGSLQHIGSTKQTRITQEQLKIQLDSLNKLVSGSNISSAARNYLIVPGKMEKISDFTKVKVFGPFEQIPNDFNAGSLNEVFKFFNISEVNKIIYKLTEMTKYKYEKGEGQETKDVDDDSVHTIHPSGK